MIKRTLYFGNPAYLSLKYDQLLVRLPEVEKNEMLPEHFTKEAVASIPIEDIGVVIMDNQQITITQGLLEKLLNNNCALINCDTRHMPLGLLLPLTGHTVQTERYKQQIEASKPLKKQLWQQTVQAKIENQAYLLNTLHGTEVSNMYVWVKEVRSGDADNHEARAAVYYWANFFPRIKEFTRVRDGMPPNHLLNYGYAILRAIIARAIVGSGLLPALGIYHRNKYNAFCLADDLMEPYRPFVDNLVYDIVQQEGEIEELTKGLKARLLSIPVLDVKLNGQQRPLMVAATHTAASLVKCFKGELRRINYPSFI